MLLYLMRHGIAESGLHHASDADRALTPEGHRRMQQQARALARLQPPWSAVLSSRYVRAQQTAQIIAKATGLSTHEDATLQPGCSLDDLAGALSGYERWPLVVFHQPSIGRIVYELTGARLSIEPGTVVAVQSARLREGSGVLHAVYPPDALVALSP